MSKDNHIYPSKDAVFKMYKYLTTYENTVAAHPGEFDLESKELQQFLVKQNIIIKPVSKSKFVKDLARNNYIVYICGDHKTEYDDKAHDLLRYIRNAIGHALITKTAVNRACFNITDKNKNQSITMRGNIEESSFFALLEQLIKTKK